MSRQPTANAARIAKVMMQSWNGQNTVDVVDAWVSASAYLIAKMGGPAALEVAIQDLRNAIALNALNKGTRRQ